MVALSRAGKFPLPQSMDGARAGFHIYDGILLLLPVELYAKV